MSKSKGWVIATVFAAALLPAPSVEASELVKLAKLLVTGKRAPAATGGSEQPAKPATPPQRQEGAERWTAPRAQESGGSGEGRGPLANLRSEATEGTTAPVTEWQGQDRGESVRPTPTPAPADAQPPSRGDRFEIARATISLRRSLA